MKRCNTCGHEWHGEDDRCPACHSSDISTIDEPTPMVEEVTGIEEIVEEEEEPIDGLLHPPQEDNDGEDIEEFDEPEED